MSLARAIRRRSRTYDVERRSAVTTDPTTGGGLGGTVTEGTIFAHIQGYDGPRRADSVAGVDTSGMVKIWVADSVSVALGGVDGGELRCDPGEGGTGAPGDIVIWDSHRWLVIERQRWAEDGSFRQYLARDEGAA